MALFVFSLVNHGENKKQPTLFLRAEEKLMLRSEHGYIIILLLPDQYILRLPFLSMYCCIRYAHNLDILILFLLTIYSIVVCDLERSISQS